MAKPRIFISSTHFDFKHIRASLESFIFLLGYEPVLSEKGSIPYNPDVSLDQSCYREVENCDIFVLLIGGRYGSEAGDVVKSEKRFYDYYDSIARQEYQSALKKDVPCYVLIEKAVYSEYETFQQNRSKRNIKYAHVDSVNIFNFIDSIMSLPRNNPICTFDKYAEIEAWLREQWSGLFRDMINRRSERRRLASLSKEVDDLHEIVKTLRIYLEEIVKKSSDKGEKLVKKEDQRLRRHQEFSDLQVVRDLIEHSDLDVEDVRKLLETAISLEDLAHQAEAKTHGTAIAEVALRIWKSEPQLVQEINHAREILSLKPLKFAG